jgi:hypothetical protein
MSATSLGAESSDQSHLPKPIAAEITRIKNDAIITGVRTGLIATIGAAVVALLLSTQLPLRSRHVDDPGDNPGVSH